MSDTLTDQICQRTACTTEGLADHLGSAHLDPRDREHFDGNEISLRAATYRVRNGLSVLNQVSRRHPDLAEIVDVAIHAALEEIELLGQQVAHVRVDADRKIREASRVALDCEHHGQTIRGLEEQVEHFAAAEQRAEKGRLALLAGITAFDYFARGADVALKNGRPLPDMAAVVESIRGVLKKVHAAHTRAWAK